MFYVASCAQEAIDKLEESKVYSSTTQIEKCLRGAIDNIVVAIGYLKDRPSDE